MKWFDFQFKIPSAGESLSTVFTDPKIYITLLVVIAIGAALLYVTRVKLTTKVMINVSLAVALGTVLKMFQIMKMPAGGSVTLGSMVPIIFIAYVYGARVGYLAGLLFGILDLLLGAYVVHPVQLVLEYMLAFTVLGVAGYFKNNIVFGTIIAIGLRFVFHVLAGVVFFAEYAGNQNVWIYSIQYNGTYLLPEAIIAVVVLSMIPVKRLRSELLRGMA